MQSFLILLIWKSQTYHYVLQKTCQYFISLLIIVVWFHWYFFLCACKLSFERYFNNTFTFLQCLLELNVSPWGHFWNRNHFDEQDRHCHRSDRLTVALVLLGVSPWGCPWSPHADRAIFFWLALSFLLKIATALMLHWHLWVSGNTCRHILALSLTDDARVTQHSMSFVNYKLNCFHDYMLINKLIFAEFSKIIKGILQHIFALDNYIKHWANY